MAVYHKCSTLGFPGTTEGPFPEQYPSPQGPGCMLADLFPAFASSENGSMINPWASNPSKHHPLQKKMLLEWVVEDIELLCLKPEQVP